MSDPWIRPKSVIDPCAVLASYDLKTLRSFSLEFICMTWYHMSSLSLNLNPLV